MMGADGTSSQEDAVAVLAVLKATDHYSAIDAPQEACACTFATCARQHGDAKGSDNI